MKGLILTGACGVGKSTIARAWAQKNSGAFIDCDFFTEWIMAKEFPFWTKEEEQLTANIAVDVAKRYLTYGLPTAIEYAWSPVGVTILRNALHHHDFLFLHLYCNLEENLRRDHSRIPENRMNERVAVLKSELENYSWPGFVKHLDTSGLTVEQTLKKIEDAALHSLSS